jgi:4-diphosphocytidyl-2-C-methyl-D-erythritol kinase
VPANSSETKLEITGIPIYSPVENNLCYKAWRLMADKYSIPPVAMHLHKVIPAGAGLGGGSSDASFTLRMLNTMFSLNLDNEILRSLAVQLGMDCSFFIENLPALSTGRGEFLKPVSVNLNGYYIVIVKPPVHVSTAAAFLGTKPLYRENSIEEITNLPLTDWKHELHNDFEDTVFDLYPEIQDIRNLMYRHGAIYSAMSGSGSAVYGLFKESPVQMECPGCDVFQYLLGSHS